MKLLTTLQRSKTRFLAKLPPNLIEKSTPSLGIFVLVVAVLWLAGPSLTLNGMTPFADVHNRIFVTVALLTLWVLKVLLLDWDSINPLQVKDPELRKKIQMLQNRFQGAMEFLKTTTITKQDKAVDLYHLPWFLLLGPKSAGKTSALALAHVNYILQKQFHDQQLEKLPPSQHCDWWLTKEAAIVDVPANYLYAPSNLNKNGKEKSYAASPIWKYFLQLIKNQRGNLGMGGVVIALPLPELMQGDLKQYQAMQRNLLQRLHELHLAFKERIPCTILITKCDLLPGFSEFFSEAGDDEIQQAWGIQLPERKAGEKITDIFTQRFNALIRKLNEQLLWRLHQERNPMARPYIKDFPLQIERLKEYINDFVKKLGSQHFNFTLQGIYLTSALQHQDDPEADIIDEPNTTQRALQLFKEPAANSRTFFLKQFITHGLTVTPHRLQPASKFNKWKYRIAYTFSALIISTAAMVLGKDFQIGMQQAHAIQANIDNYQYIVLKSQNPDDHLVETLNLLNKLQTNAINTEFKFDLPHILTFYSNKSEKKAHDIYNQALKSVLLPEIKIYFEEFLKTPVNKNVDMIYSALKAYLMLGNASYYDAAYIEKILKLILPNNMQAQDKNRLMQHVTLALKAWAPLALNIDSISETQKYLTNIPSIQLSYIILKNINDNNINTTINLGSKKNNAVFTLQKNTTQIPTMFTIEAYNKIVTEEIALATNEALTGNWIIGNINSNATNATTLAEQLHAMYVNNYITTWEGLLANIELNSPTNLSETDAMIDTLIRGDSPLLLLLHTLRDNTYFDPIATASNKLQTLDELVTNTDQNDNQLYLIFSGLQGLHQYLQTVLSSDNEKKAAFTAISKLVQMRDATDSITQLHLIAAKSPEPIKTWLDKIANHAWHFLLQDASHYLDTSWQNQVGKFYRSEIADRYPFATNATHEVKLDKFSEFFGNPGIVISFYNNYLQPLVDATNAEWRWKTFNTGQKLPFSDDTLRQIQHAMRIHQALFPNDGNKLALSFKLQPYQFDPKIRAIKVNINDKQIVDQRIGSRAPHEIVWPIISDNKVTSVQLTLDNQQMINRNYTGDWGWFKLVNKSFESIVSKKQIMINLSQNVYLAKYLIITDSPVNPFLTLNLSHFQLPDKLIIETA